MGSIPGERQFAGYTALLCLRSGLFLRARIFKCSNIFDRVPNLRINKSYVVVGRVTPNNYIIEVINMS